MPSPAAIHPVHRDSPECAADVTPTRTSPRRVRWRPWIGLLAIVVAIRFLLTLVVLAPFAEVRLSRILDARVHVGGVRLAPIDGIITLSNVVVRPSGDHTDGAEPIVTAKRVYLDMQWLPLLHHSLVLRELTLDGAHIDLERVRAAGWTLDHVREFNPATELPAAWSFALNRVVLRDTKVRLHPGETKDAPPLEVAVREALVSTARRRASAFGRVPNLRVDARVGDGRVLVNGSSDIRDDGVVINARVHLKDVPVEPFEAYRPDFLSASRIGGRVSARLSYQRDPGRRDRLTGQLRGRHMAVHVSTLVEPAALAVRRLDAEIVGIDLRQQRVAIGTLTLHGADLAVRPDLRAPFPLLDALYAASAPVPAEPHRTRRPGTWGWSIGHLQAPSARLLDTETSGERALALSVVGDSVGPAAYWSPLRAAIGWEGGTAMFDGTIRMTRGFTVAGRLTANEMDAVAVARAIGPPLATVVQTGLVSADLDVELAIGADDGLPLDARGYIGVRSLWAADEDPDEFAFGAHAIDLRLARILPAPDDGEHAGAVAIELDSVAVASPYLKLTRTAEGSPADTTIEPSEQPAQAARSPVTLAVANASMRDGRLLILDDTTTPPVALDLTAVNGSLRDFREPVGGVEAFAVQGMDARFGFLRLTGVRNGEQLKGELYATDFALAATAPYFRRTGLPYAFTSGRGAAHAIYSSGGNGWSADTTVTLREPILGGDQDLLKRSLGMAPAAALAAVHERHGEILLRLPVASSQATDARLLTTAFAGSVREALVRPRWVPLPDAPLRVAFVSGRPDPTPDAARQLAAIADIQAARPDVVLELRAVISRADRRWIAEQAIAADRSNQPGGFRALLRAVGVRDQRTRIHDALAARAAGESGELDAKDEAALDALVAAAPPVPTDRLTSLARGRAALVAKLLTEQHRVVVARLVDADPAVPESATAVVEARFLPTPGMGDR